MTQLLLDRISAAYGDTRVLYDFTLSVNEGEFVALLGPSGCGKTTVLKIIAGLLAPVSGDVRFDGQSIVNVAAERRGAAMVFQKPLLFPYLTVAENVAFGLKMQGVAKAEREARVREALELVQLSGYEARKPSQLSGGQEQRVALARALVIAPRVLLLDEPFSALDESLRAEMRLLVRDLQQRLRITTIFVTHDQDEAASMANRIALLLDGKLEQYGEPREFYIAPSTLKAARFFGWKMIEHENGWLAFRPESLRIKPDNKTTSAEVIEIEANVKTRLDLGTRQRYRVALQNGEEMEFEEVNLSGMPRLLNDPNASLILTLPASATRFFPAAY